MSKRGRNVNILALVAISSFAAFAAFTQLRTGIHGAIPTDDRRQIKTHLTVTVSEVKTLPAPIPKVEFQQISGKETCFIDENTRKQRCTQSQANGIPLAEKALPLLLGVGPAKTSSTALFDALGSHPEVLLGDVSLQGHTCCGSELYYFSRRFNSTNPAAGLGAYFPINSKPTALWAAEKTPEYSDHFLAPYRVRATLQPSALALVFTIRDPVDAHVSLYFYRMQRKKLKASAKGFLEWSSALLKAHHLYRECVRKELAANDYKEPISTEMSPCWVGEQHLDEAVFEACRAPYFKPSDRLEGVGSLEYSQTLPRWKRVFDSVPYSSSSKVYFQNAAAALVKSNNTSSSKASTKNASTSVPMMCVFHQDFISNPERETKRVAQFIGVDLSKLDRSSLPTGSGSIEKSGRGPNGDITISQLSGEERVFASEGATDPETARALWKHLNKLRGLFSGEMEFAQQFCSELAAGDEDNSLPPLNSI